ncbi:MAG: hypothetical protein IAB81_04030 [Bacteroidetes bacterium]|uniref:Uncharacterized protein n=1 Tax=Candidatus Merdivivens pullicola TaxID=2840872 RepID=A0A9D9IH97_9BACT|nr:hypothetical protein [Candidatus Merdivivens pullicola]
MLSARRKHAHSEGNFQFDYAVIAFPEPTFQISTLTGLPKALLRQAFSCPRVQWHNAAPETSGAIGQVHRDLFRRRRMPSSAFSASLMSERNGACGVRMGARLTPLEWVAYG